MLFKKIIYADFSLKVDLERKEICKCYKALIHLSMVDFKTSSFPVKFKFPRLQVKGKIYIYIFSEKGYTVTWFGHPKNHLIQPHKKLKQIQVGKMHLKKN